MTSKDLTLAVDVGTGSVRAALVNHRDGQILAFRSRPHEQISLHHGWSEQRPAEWWAGTLASVREVVAAVPGSAARVAAVCVCGQMHGTVLLDAEGRLTRETAPLWNDKRAQGLADAYRREHAPEQYLKAVANPPAAPWPAFKLQWFKQHDPEAYRRTACVLMPKDYINFRLTGVRAFDLTEASLSFLMDPATRDWSPAMIEELGLDRSMLPPIREPTDLLGAVTAAAAAETGLLPGTPVVVGASDFPMALLGSGVCRPGLGADVTGTGSIITLIGEKPLLHPEIANIATPNGLWGAFVIIDSGGDAMRWARRAFHENALDFDAMVTRAAQAPAGSDGLFFLPYLNGQRFGAKNNSRAQFFGLTSRHGTGHLHRAILEGVAFGLRRHIGLVKAAGGKLDRLIASGGGAKTRLWLEIKASMFDVPIAVPEEPESGLIGCAALVAAVTGERRTPADAADALNRFGEDILPDPRWQERYDRMAPIFDRLYTGAQAFYDDLDALEA